jgi:hypothetical protein
MFGEIKNHTADVMAEGDDLAKHYEVARRQYEKALPEVARLQAEAEITAARGQALDYTTGHDFPEALFRERREQLEHDLAAAVAKRDGLIVPLDQAVRAAKQVLFSFNARIVGRFVSWQMRVSSALPAGHALAGELAEARKKLEQMYLSRTTDVIAIIRRSVERVERDPRIEAPIFRLPDVPVEPEQE